MTRTLSEPSALSKTKPHFSYDLAVAIINFQTLVIARKLTDTPLVASSTEKLAMTILTLDHVNVRTTLMEQSRRFYQDLLGMTVAPAPGASDLDVGAWVHSSDGRPLRHLNRAPEGADFLGEERNWKELSGSAQVHHVAFRCADYEATLARLQEAGLALRFMDVPQIGLRQIFVRDPNDILIELNFLSDAA